MKTPMKYLVAIACTLLLAVSSLNAFSQKGQGKRNPDPAKFAEKQTQRMTKALSLSEDQQEKVKAINLKYAQKGKEARGKTNKKERRAARKTIRTERMAELKTVLSAEQYTKYEKNSKKKGKRKKGKKRKGQGAGDGAGR